MHFLFERIIIQVKALLRSGDSGLERNTSVPEPQKQKIVISVSSLPKLCLILRIVEDIVRLGIIDPKRFLFRELFQKNLFLLFFQIF